MTARFLSAAAPVALALAAAMPSALVAQGMVQSLAPTDADLLAAQIRQLGANPRDLTALATAGELSMRVGDLSAAAALFARADKIDPRNGRVKAGMAAVLVRSERPGEALRFFQQAEVYNWPVARFAADRGLAYDLIGEQERAQRDYRLALKGGTDDETARRYALSLGISGRQAQALAQLDPLVRRQDRAAWRARAFVLAMTGDTPGAAKIATTMMPAGMAQGLAAFFQRLPTLGSVDRAFAVHFGEVFATPERLADARLTPALTPLMPEPGVAPPVQVAAVVPPTRDRGDRRSRRGRERDRRTSSAAAPAVALAQAPPPQPPRPVVMAATRPVVQPLPRNEPIVVASRPIPTVAAARPLTSPVQASTAPVVMRETDVRVAATAPVPVTAGTAPAIRPISPPPSVGSTTLATTALPAQMNAAPAAVQSSALTAATPIRTTPLPASTSVRMPLLPAPVPAPAALAASTSAVTPGGLAVTTATSTARSTSIVAATPAPGEFSTSTPFGPPDTQPVAVAAAPAPVVAPVETAAATERTDSVLARIVASLSIPASELGVAPLRPEPTDVVIPAAVARAPASPIGKRVIEEASAKEARDASVRRTVAAKLNGNPEADDTRTARGRRAADARALGARSTGDGEGEDSAPAARTARGRKAADARALAAKDIRGRRPAEDESPLDPKARRAADKKLLADKKAAAEKKVLADAEAAETKAARTRPARIWVQVAGGANEGDLSKAWRAAQAKAPALAGKSGYTTPLRATNRVLTGPFKTEAEARVAVNQLAKQGVSAFTFTSDAGQDVKKLGSK